ncbi:MAG: thioesterase family protein [Ilumatobacteraceae bacterium]
MAEFDDATHIAADGTGEIAPGWDIGGNANGGYLLALAARHLRDVSGRPDPITVTGHYLAPGTAGPVQIDSQLIKSGKRFATVTGTMRRDGRPMLQVLGCFGDAAFGGNHVDINTLRPPELPPIEECVRRSPTQGRVEVAMMDRLDVYLRPQDVGFAEEQPSGSGEMVGWFSFIDGRPIDTLALLMVCDALPPAVFNLDVPAGWVPTIEYTVHVRGVPAPGPVRCIFRTSVVNGGFLQEDGEVWDSADRLVAMSRQLALIALV